MTNPTGMCTPDPRYMSWMHYLLVPVLDMPSTNTHANLRPRSDIIEMDRLRDIPDDSDVAEFDSIVLKGREIKRLRPGAWLCDGSVNAWFEYLSSKFDLEHHPEVKLILPTVMGGLLMPIKEGGKLRSPRSHAAAIRQEVSEYWDVDWANIKLVFIPLCDGYKKPGVHQGFYWFDSQPGDEHEKLAAEAVSYFAPLIPGCSAEVRPFVGMPHQANSHDCGVMLSASAEWILSQFFSRQNFPWDAAELTRFLCRGDGSSYRLKMVDAFLGWNDRK